MAGAVMRRVSVLAAAALVAFSLMGAKPAGPAGTISLDGVGPFAIGDVVTFDTSVSGLKGSQYPMVYLKCTVGGRTVYGQLDYPSTAFVLGGGSSPWIDPRDPDYRKPALCVGQLWVYVPWHQQRPGNVFMLDETVGFVAG